MPIGVCDVLAPSGEDYPVVSASDVWYSDSTSVESRRPVVMSYQLREADLKSKPLSHGVFAPPYGISALPDCPDITMEELYSRYLAGSPVSVRIQVLRANSIVDRIDLHLVSVTCDGREMTFESASWQVPYNADDGDCTFQFRFSVPSLQFPTASLKSQVMAFSSARVIPTSATPVIESSVPVLNDVNFSYPPDVLPRCWRSGRVVQLQIHVDVADSDGSAFPITASKAVPVPVSEFRFVCPDMVSMSSCATLIVLPDGSLSVRDAVPGGAYLFSGTYLANFS